MITFRNILAAAIAAGSLAGMSAPAHAGGLLADTFIRPFSPELADAADQANRALGHPAERVGGAILDGVVPGSGSVAQEVWARNGGYRGPSGIQWGGNRGQGPIGPQGSMGGGWGGPTLGSFCHTPQGRFGPGPANPLGVPCWIATPYGPVTGQVGN